jgi:hypothetical protein
MEKRLTKSECGVLYSKFLHSDRNIVDFCTENSIPYLQFADYINRHENRYGVTMVETAMERTELARYGPDSLNGREIPARGENLFQELALELDSSKFRSKARFTNNPSFQVELTAPKPDTIIRKAVLTLPSGIEVTLSEASIKSLIMAVVLYEEANTWINE